MSSLVDVEVEEEYLFDEQLIRTLRWDGSEKISAIFTDLNLIVRPLKSGDYERGFIALLSQLTEMGDVSKQQFVEHFNRMKLCNTHYIAVMEDVMTGQVIGCLTLLVELKFIRTCALKGYMEDLVISPAYRGKNLGKIFMEIMTQLAKRVGVYKVVLNCNDRLIKFYEDCGYVREDGNANMLQIRFNIKEN